VQAIGPAIHGQASLRHPKADAHLVVDVNLGGLACRFPGSEQCETAVSHEDRGKALAGKSTLNRLELGKSGQIDKYKKILMQEQEIDAWMVRAFIDAHGSAPDEIVLDLDATDDLIHGNQEGRFFYGYYCNYCYLPLYIFSGGHLLCARLRRSNIDGAEGSVEELTRIVGQIRQNWPEVKIIMRADSGFCRDDLMSWCEKNGIDYVLGLAKNSRLKKEIAEEMNQTEALFGQTQRPSRVFKDFRYQTLDSWTCQRRVIGKAEWMEKSANRRFVVTLDENVSKTCQAAALLQVSSW
jgi:hypothetical protein